MKAIMTTFNSCSTDPADEQFVLEDQNFISRSILTNCPEPILKVTVIPDDFRTCSHLLVQYLGTDQPETNCVVTSIELKVGPYNWDLGNVPGGYDWYNVTFDNFPTYLYTDFTGFPVSPVNPQDVKGNIVPQLFPIYTGDGTSPNDEFEVLVRFNDWYATQVSIVCVQVSMICPAEECDQVNEAGEYTVDICQTIYHPCW
jgi:hypothetical protein